VNIEYPGADCTTDEELVKACGDIGTTIFHPVGTCRMGHINDFGSVVDSELRVKCINGLRYLPLMSFISRRQPLYYIFYSLQLRIADASVMPTITSGNTAAPTMMIAQRLAELLCPS